MKRKMLLLLTCLLAVAVPFGAMAMNHEKEMSHQGHGAMEAAEGQGGHEQSMHDMAGQAGAIMLGSTVEDGVKATAQLNDMREVMASMGMKETHHFMVSFAEEASGGQIAEGTVALRIKGPDGTETGPIQLMDMAGQFGADVSLPDKGSYELTVGSRLQDGKTRQFVFSYEVE
ncbi:MAG: hypothetical protein WC952_12415 [Desulfobulbaceae bacterium]